MKLKTSSALALAASAALGAPVIAGTMSIKVTLPVIESSGFRPPTRPYVALWLRRANADFAKDLAVWYEVEEHHGRRGGPGNGSPGEPVGRPPGDWPPGAQRSGPWAGPPREGDSALPPVQSANTPGGARWLNGVREWWADSGHALKFPVDGLTSASRPSGTYELTFAATDPKLADLPPGRYLLMVEAAREHGGDEMVSIPFTWPVIAPQSGQGVGKAELGTVQLTLAP